MYFLGFSYTKYRPARKGVRSMDPLRLPGTVTVFYRLPPVGFPGGACTTPCAHAWCRTLRELALHACSICGDALGHEQDVLWSSSTQLDAHVRCLKTHEPSPN